MEKEICNLSFNSVENTLEVKDASDKTTVINYSEDVDFTELIEVLSLKIDTQLSIELNEVGIKYDLLTPKEQLIYNTTKSIIDSYNNSFFAEEANIA